MVHDQNFHRLSSGAPFAEQAGLGLIGDELQDGHERSGLLQAQADGCDFEFHGIWPPKGQCFGFW